MHRSKYILLIGLVALVAAAAVTFARSPATVATRDSRSVDHASPNLANLVGVSLPTAYARLHREGFKVTFQRAFSIDWSGECIPIVTGATVLTVGAGHAGSTALLATKIPPCAVASPFVPVPRPAAVRVPKFTGRPLTAAISWIAEHQLSWAATIPPLAAGSAASLYANYTIASQQPRPGGTLAVGIARGSGWQPTPLQLTVRQTPAQDGAAALAHGHWQVLARSPLGSPSGASFIWTGRMLLELGGTGPANQSRVLRTGAAYDPRSGRWRRIANVPVSVLADDAATVWTGSKLFVFGGTRLAGVRPTGIAGLYDPGSNHWTLTPPAPITSALPSDDATAVWDGRQVVLAAVSDSEQHATLQTAAYDPDTDRWRGLALALPHGHYPLAAELVSTNAGVLLWALWSRSQPIGSGSFAVYSGVDVYRLHGGVWRSVTGAWPQHRTVDQPLYTGSGVLLGGNQIWCGSCSHPAPSDVNGWSVNPVTLKITKLPHGPLDDLQPQILWSGAAEIALDSSGEIEGPHERILPGDIAFLDLATGRWYRGAAAPRTPGPLPAVWDGSHLLILDQRGQLLSYGVA